MLEGGSRSIEEVPDPVFAEKTLGDGAAIEPDDCVITAPCNGIITAVMSETKHAVGIDRKSKH